MEDGGRRSLLLLHPLKSPLQLWPGPWLACRTMEWWVRRSSLSSPDAPPGGAALHAGHGTRGHLARPPPPPPPPCNPSSRQRGSIDHFKEHPAGRLAAAGSPADPNLAKRPGRQAGGLGLVTSEGGVHVRGCRAGRLRPAGGTQPPGPDPGLQMAAVAG